MATVFLIVVLVIGGCLQVGAFEERSTYTYCRHCGTDREAHEYRLGPVRLRQGPRLHESPAFRDLLDADHVHAWQLNCTTWRSAGTEGIG